MYGSKLLHDATLSQWYTHRLEITDTTLTQWYTHRLESCMPQRMETVCSSYVQCHAEISVLLKAAER